MMRSSDAEDHVICDRDPAPNKFAANGKSRYAGAALNLT